MVFRSSKVTLQAGGVSGVWVSGVMVWVSGVWVPGVIRRISSAREQKPPEPRATSWDIRESIIHCTTAIYFAGCTSKLHNI